MLQRLNIEPPAPPLRALQPLFSGGNGGMNNFETASNFMQNFPSPAAYSYAAWFILRHNPFVQSLDFRLGNGVQGTWRNQESIFLQSAPIEQPGSTFCFNRIYRSASTLYRVRSFIRERCAYTKLRSADVLLNWIVSGCRIQSND